MFGEVIFVISKKTGVKSANSAENGVKNENFPISNYDQDGKRQKGAGNKYLKARWTFIIL